jgi:hypothetical protein
MVEPIDGKSAWFDKLTANSLKPPAAGQPPVRHE